MPAPIEIVYTPEIFSIQPVGGISRYFAELVRGMRAAGQRPHVAAGLHVNEYLRYTPAVRGLRLRLATVRAARQRYWFNQTLCRAMLAFHPRAVVHLTYFSDASYLRRQPLVVTVYDMIHELFCARFPELGGADDPSLRHKRLNCERADHLIAISQSTKDDLVRLFAVDPARVTVIPLSSSLPPVDPASPPVAVADPYLLHVGTRSGYKNFRVLLEAFGRSATLPRQFRLVCFGGGTFSDEERAAIAALGLERRVMLQPGGSDEALTRCYRGAAAFVCPSLYEGFGLPVLEAMSQGCPVVCSRAGSLPEVAGEDAAYFDPLDPASICAVLETTLADTARLAALRTAGPARARRFSWERCVRETLAVYQQLASRS